MKWVSFLLGSLVGAIVLLTSSCGQIKEVLNPSSPAPATKSKAVVQKDKVVLPSSSLVGTWYSSCLPVSDQVGKYFKETKVITTASAGGSYDQIATITITYNDALCATPYYTVRSNASFSVSGSAGNTVLTETYVSVSVASNHDQVTQYFSTGKGFCGQKNWKTGVAQTFVPVNKCPGFPLRTQSPLQLKNASAILITYCKGFPSVCTQYPYSKLIN